MVSYQVPVYLYFNRSLMLAKYYSNIRSYSNWYAQNVEKRVESSEEFIVTGLPLLHAYLFQK